MGKGFLKRLGWYLVGLSIGLVFFVFIVKKKSGDNKLEICYFPNCRVLKDIRSKPISYNNGIASHFMKDSILWKSFFKQGNVDFGASDVKAKPCKNYFIDNANGNRIGLKNCPDSVIVESFQ